jgi:hypothetical protein
MPNRLPALLCLVVLPLLELALAGLSGAWRHGSVGGWLAAPIGALWAGVTLLLVRGVRGADLGPPVGGARRG